MSPWLKCFDSRSSRSRSPISIAREPTPNRLVLWLHFPAFREFLARLVGFPSLRWYNRLGRCFSPATERTVQQPSKQDGGFSKLDCFFHFDQLNHWLSRMRDLIATSETYKFPAFRESFRELRRNSVK